MRPSGTLCAVARSAALFGSAACVLGVITTPGTTTLTRTPPRAPSSAAIRGELNQGRLGRAVASGARRTEQAHNRRDVHNAAATLRLHSGYDGAYAEKAPSRLVRKQVRQSSVEVSAIMPPA